MELSDNNFDGKELKNIPITENLAQLRLANTKIKSFEDLECLKKFKNLTFLELEESPISKLENYRTKIFDMLPELVYLDNTSIDGQCYLQGIFSLIFKIICLILVFLNFYFLNYNY